MFLELSHTKLDVYNFSRKLSLECYKTTATFPNDEKFILVQQARRAAVSVHLNIAEGSSRKSAVERKRYYEIARGSIVEMDAVFDIAETLTYCTKENLSDLGETIVRTYKMLSALINSTNN